MQSLAEVWAANDDFSLSVLIHGDVAEPKYRSWLPVRIYTVGLSEVAGEVFLPGTDHGLHLRDRHVRHADVFQVDQKHPVLADARNQKFFGHKLHDVCSRSCNFFNWEWVDFVYFAEPLYIQDQKRPVLFISLVNVECPLVDQLRVFVLRHGEGYGLPVVVLHHQIVSLLVVLLVKLSPAKDVPVAVARRNLQIFWIKPVLEILHDFIFVLVEN